MAQQSRNKKKVADYWSGYYSRKRRVVENWWQYPPIVRLINENVAGTPSEGMHSGLRRQLRRLAGPRLPFRRGISVGCGFAQKEIRLLTEGFVQTFDLYEISEVALQKANESAKEANVEHRVRIHNCDAFDHATTAGAFDFVHWSGSLHHMLNVDDALAWSRHVCADGGLFYMDEYVGPNRFQWSETELAIARDVRNALPDKFFRPPPLPDGTFPRGMLPRQLYRTPPDQIADPSEAADSSRILQCVKKHFPEAIVQPTGGVAYFIAFAGILHNFDESTDLPILRLCMLTDALCARQGMTLYAVALGIKGLVV